MKKTNIISLFFASIFIYACSGNHSQKEQMESQWTKEERKEFISRCVTNQKSQMDSSKAKKYCQCLVGKIEKKYPTFDSAQNMKRTDIQEFTKKCMEQNKSN